MTKVLVINASLQSEKGKSSQLTNHFADSYKKRYQNAEVSVRDLANEPLPHLDGETMGAWMTPAEARTASQQAAVERSDQAIAQVMDSDVIVVGVPMYNFSVPSTLKAWMDHVARAGITFRYTENGPEGLIKGKRVIIVRTSGGQYQNTPMDSQTPLLNTFFTFLGFEQIEFVYAEGLAMGEAQASEAFTQAQGQLEALVA